MEAEKSVNKSGDPLNFLMEFLGIRYQKRFGIFKIFLTVLAVSFQSLHLTELFVVIDEGLFLKYACFMVISQPSSLGFLPMMDLMDRLKEVKEAFVYCYPIDSRGRDLEKKILSDSKKIKLYTILTIVVLTIGHLLLTMPFVGDEKTFNPIWLVVEKYASTWKHAVGIITCVYCLSSILLSYGVMYTLISGTYQVYQLIFQFDLLNDRLLAVSEGNSGIEDKHFYDKRYQEGVYRELRACIRQHINILRLTAVYSKNLKISILCIKSGALLPVAACYFMIYDISPKSNFRMVLILMGFFLFVALTSFGGERLVTSSSRLFQTAVECPWVYWEAKNKKALLLLIIASRKPITFSSYGGIEINLRLLFLFVKWTYSLVAFLR